MTNSIDERIQQLEDVAAIEKLTATYALAVDFGLEGRMPDRDTISSVFAEDATWFTTATGETTRGRDAITELLGAPPEGMDFAMHSFTNPIIEVDGDSASATFLLWVGITGDEVFQRENLTYARTASGWVIQSIDLRFGRMLNA